MVTYDTRGHGESPAPAGPYSLDDLVDDLVALLDEVGAERAHVVGLSLGGMTAMRLAAREPERVDRLALLCTSAKPDPQPFLDRAAAVRSGGTAPRAGRGQPVADAAVRRRAPRPGRAAGGDDRRLRRRGLRRLLRGGRAVDLRDDLRAHHRAHPRRSAGGRTRPAPPEHQQVIADAIPAPSCSPSAPAPTSPTWSSRSRSPARCSATSTPQEEAAR